jgi:MFS family permease
VTGHDAEFRRWALVIGAGFLATTLPQAELLDLPFRRLLESELKVSQQDMALFFLVAVSPWNFKPLFGLLCDAVPLFGTRRRSYVIIAAGIAGVLWLAMGFVPHSFAALAALLFAINLMLVLASAALGGLLAELAQRSPSYARLVSVRAFVESVCLAISGTLSGWLAGLPFGIATLAGAVISLSVAPIAWLWLREEPVRYSAVAFRAAVADLRAFAASRIVWAAVALVFVASLSQTFTTPLFFLQRNALGFPVETIGYLNSVTGLASIAAPLLYVMLQGRVAPRKLLALSLAGAAFGVAGFCFYGSVPQAVAIHAAYGFLNTMLSVAVLDLAARMAPQAAAATGFSVMVAAWNVGGSAGDNIAAALIERWGFGFNAVMLMFAGVALAAALVTWRLRADETA